MTDLRNASRFVVLLVAATVLGATLGATTAQAQIKKGDTLLLFQLTDGDVTLASPPFTTLAGDYITAYHQTEWGGGLQIQHLVSEDWAFTIGGGIGTLKETDQADPASGGPDVIYKQSSWNARIGADRFIHITPNAHLFAGPGLMYWSGKGKDELSGTTTDRPTTKRVALDGRMGATIGLGASVGLTGQIGRYIGHSTATDDVSKAKASWWSSGGDGQVGLYFKF